MVQPRRNTDLANIRIQYAEAVTSRCRQQPSQLTEHNSGIAIFSVFLGCEDAANAECLNLLELRLSVCGWTGDKSFLLQGFTGGEDRGRIVCGVYKKPNSQAPVPCERRSSQSKLAVVVAVDVKASGPAVEVAVDDMVVLFRSGGAEHKV